MNKKLLSTQEVMRVQANIQKIEFGLGRPIPPGMIDVTEYSDHILSQSEVNRVVANMTKVGYRAKTTSFEDFIATYIILPIVAVGALKMFVEFIISKL